MYLHGTYAYMVKTVRDIRNEHISSTIHTNDGIHLTFVNIDLIPVVCFRQWVEFL